MKLISFGGNLNCTSQMALISLYLARDKNAWAREAAKKAQEVAEKL